MKTKTNSLRIQLGKIDSYSPSENRMTITAKIERD